MGESLQVAAWRPAPGWALGVPRSWGVDAVSSRRPAVASQLSMWVSALGHFEFLLLEQFILFKVFPLK